MTTSAEVSAEVQDFLHDRILSYEQLETLLLLHSRRNETFSPTAVAELLHVPEQAAADLLDRMLRQRLLAMQVVGASIRFSYGPDSAALAGVVDQLAESYSHDRLAVMDLMNANAMERVRTQARNAFVLDRKKDKEG